MKRILTLLLAAGLVLSAGSAAKAVDIHATGTWELMGQIGDQSFQKDQATPGLTAVQRFRTQIDVIASESLKGVVFLEIGHQHWGSGEDGASLGTDGYQVKVRYSYVDWAVPDTDLKVRMGLQNFSLPNFSVPGGSPVLGSSSSDGAGITVSAQLTDNVGATLFWLRAENDNLNKNSTGYHFSDSMDFLGLTVPLTFDGWQLTPWGMYGFVGRDSFGGNSGLSYEMRPYVFPAGFNPYSLDYDRHGNAWWVGAGGQITRFAPFALAADAAYGRLDMGDLSRDGRTFEYKREGWYASISAQYSLDHMTPALLFWYSSGDDGNPYNGSERLPAISPSWDPSGYAFDDDYYDSACDLIGQGNSGTMGVYAYLRDISFMENLSHVLRVGFIKGTNNTEMVRGNGLTPSGNDLLNPYSGYALYLTTSDKAWEVNFDTYYNIYKDLQFCLELGYINLDLDRDVWTDTVVDANKKNIFRGAANLKYTF